MCLHIENIDMISYQTAKCNFTFFLNFSLTPVKIRNISLWLSCPKGGINILVYIGLKVIHLQCILSRVIFLSKKCKLFFCSVYMSFEILHGLIRIFDFD